MMSNGKQSFVPIGSQNDSTRKAKQLSKFYSEDETSDEEMLDLSKPLYPLSHYVDDEDELVAQIFTTIKHEKLKPMMPPMLRDIPPIYLQQLCLHELTGMSRNRILAAINGEEMSSSSSDSDDSDEEEKPLATNALVKPESKLDMAEFGKLSDAESKERALSDLKKEVDAGKGNLTALDLFELEMRAKVIKNMLGKDTKPTTTEEQPSMDDVVIKQEPVSPEKLEISVDRSRSVSASSSRRSSVEKESPHKKHDTSYSSSDRSRSRSRSNSTKRSYSRSRSRSRSSNLSSSPRKNRGSSSDYSSDDSSKFSRERKGKKLTKKEFQERMKKAKMNRSYRKRNESDDDSYDELEEELKEKKYIKWKKKMEKKILAKTVQWEKQYLESMKEESKKKKAEIQKVSSPADPEEGELDETEEGEIDSVEDKEEPIEIAKEDPPPPEEDEEGACSPSDEENPKKEEEVFIEKITTYEDRPRKKRKKPRVASHEDEAENGNPLKRFKRLSRGVEEHRSAVDLKDSGPENVADDKPVEMDTETRMEELHSEENSRNDASNELPLKSIRQSISFSLPKKGLPVSRSDTTAHASISGRDEDEASSGEDFSALAEDDEIELIGESSDETEPSTSVSGTAGPRAPSAGDTDAPSPFEVKETTMDSTENSRDDKIDIIGVIETKDEDSLHAEEQDLIAGSSWSSRWLKSEKVQNVVTNTKLFSKVRKKFQMKKDKKNPVVSSKPSSPTTAITSEPVSTNETSQTPQPGVIGSIEEYEKIIGVKLQTKSPSVQLQETLALISDGSEDSEEEALWSQIMKK